MRVHDKYAGNRGAETANKLCFECIYATGGCSWSDHFIPVAGSKTAKGKAPGWVQILECPQFEEGDRLWTKEKAKALNANASSSTS